MLGFYLHCKFTFLGHDIVVALLWEKEVSHQALKHWDTKMLCFCLHCKFILLGYDIVVALQTNHIERERVDKETKKEGQKYVLPIWQCYA